MKLLLIEDDTDLAEALISALKHKEFIVEWVNHGISPNFFSSDNEYNLIILDLGLPHISGLDVLKSIRRANINTPVMVLTARDTKDDCVEALNYGADDYMTKPFDLNELIARIRALSRRSAGRAEASIVYKNIVLNPVSHTVTVDEQQVYLPRREFNLLQKFLENIGKVLTRDQLTTSIYNWDDEVDSNALEVHIHNLRKKISSFSLRTIRGIGYILEKENK
jgi:two-component system response regulator QseB